ncbi:MAG: transketolase [Deltaproteobacteria bacterium]|nr:transketolase [Deltaproteobacteria bacterium]
MNINVKAEELARIAQQVRLDTFKLAMEHKEKHIAPSLSSVEILVVLYEEIMKSEDKFILSKGHGCLSWYVVLRRKGFNPKIRAHPDIDPKNGIFCTTGSLGHGLPICVGMAFARKLKKQNGRIFVLIGDGECQEGTTWESLNIAKRYCLDNLTIIVDYNKQQAIAKTCDVVGEDNLKEKFKAFGCHTLEVDGHNIIQLLESLDEKRIIKTKPTTIIAHTIKGKGISFMEGQPEWHAKIPKTNNLIEQAYKELRV